MNGAKRNTYYTAKVDNTWSTFGIGGYQLKFVTDPNAPDVMAYGSATLLNDAHTNDTQGVATVLSTASGYADKTHYTALARVLDATDVDYYRISTPTAGANQQLVLTINIRAMDQADLAPVVQVFDSNGLAVDAQVLNNANGTYTVQVESARKGTRYYVRVAADSGTGDYQLDADVRTQVVNLKSLAAGTLSANAAVDFSTLTTSRSQVMYFELTAGALPAGIQAALRLAVFDASGRSVATLFALAGQTVSTNVYLAAGDYTVRVEALSPDGVALPALDYTLKGVTLTDPIAPVSLDPALDGGGLTPDYTLIKCAVSVYAAKSYDLLGDVIW
jgi:hypothetical protein